MNKNSKYKRGVYIVWIQTDSITESFPKMIF